MVLLRNVVFTLSLVMNLILAIALASLHKHSKKMAEAMVDDRATLQERARFCEYVLNELNSRDTKRLESLESYLNHYVDWQSQAGAHPRDIEDIRRIYAAEEFPRRANYFADLVMALSVHQQTKTLTRSTLVGYLGEPDSIRDGANGKILIYRYDWHGTKWLALVPLQGSNVVAIVYNDASMHGLE